MTQPATPQPESVSLPPTPLGDKSPQSTTSGGGAAVANATPSGGVNSSVRPMIPTRPASFSGTSTNAFSTSQHPYPDYVNRKRRTESIFSFEMGPTFSTTKQLEEIYSHDQSNRYFIHLLYPLDTYIHSLFRYQIQLHAKMDRGFFRADQDWACYRRNYFQVSSTFDVHGVNYMLQGSEVPCLLRTSQNEILQIEYFSIGVSARVTGNPDKKIELVQHTPKRDKGPQMIPKPQAIRAGGNLHLASVGSNHHIATFERMQFKTATANNGKRRAAQQYYEIVIELYGNTAQGQEICVATCHSAPLVVRGRSPGHYADSHTRYRHSSVASSSSAASSHPPPPPPPLQLPTSPPVNDLAPYYYDYSSSHHHHSPYPPTSSASDSYFQRPESKISMPPPPPVMSTDPAYYESAQPGATATAPGFYSRHPEAKVCVYNKEIYLQSGNHPYSHAKFPQQGSFIFHNTLQCLWCYSSSTTTSNST